METKDFDLICMAALRYALGSSSYIVGTVQEFLVKNAKELGKSLPKFVYEIDKYLAENPDESEWLRTSWNDCKNKLQNH